MTETQTAAIAADEGAANSARPGDEMLPFLNNFHDIFTTIGVVMLMVFVVVRVCLYGATICILSVSLLDIANHWLMLAKSL